MPRQDLRRWYRPLFRGVWAPKNAIPTLSDRARAAWLTSGRTGVITGVAASALHGADWVDDTEPIEILTAQRRRQPGLMVRMDRIGPDETTLIDGIPVTTLARTAFDLGRYQTRSKAIGRLDALMRAAPFDRAEVTTLMQRYGPVRGVRQLRELLPLVDPGAASLKESWLRLLLIDNGFPIPETQIPVFDEYGRVFAYLDMGWREIGLGVEYDGDQHRTSRPQYVTDHKRLPKIHQRGYEVIRVIAEDTKSEILERVGEAFGRRGGTEIDEKVWDSRTFLPICSFGREVA
ncbi:hypothetical protein GCM10010409_56420 [Mycolicibacterium diernhoferi]|nr:type IV toxin-antitoxin system AbiEi family antitoxin [Mycolicibacterium diernhoferi]